MKQLIKRVLVLLLALVVVCALAACGKKAEPEIKADAPAKPVPQTTTPPDEEDGVLDWLSWGLFECFIEDEWGGTLYGALEFSGDGEVDFWAGGLTSYDGPGSESYEVFETYKGTYQVSIENKGDMVTGTMSFDLGLDWWIAEFGEDSTDEELAYAEERHKIVGTYDFEAGDGTLNLELKSGQGLMHMGWPGEDIGSYSFWQTSFSGDWQAEDWFNGSRWQTTLKASGSGAAIEGYLTFDYEGNVSYDYGTGYDPRGMGMVMYRGNWYINEGWGTQEEVQVLNLALTLDSEDYMYNPGYPDSIYATYLYEFEGESLRLSYLEGDILYSPDSGEYVFYYIPMQSDFDPWYMSRSEMLDFVMWNSGYPIEAFGEWTMDYTVWWEATDISVESFCRNVWIGLYDGSSLEIELLFAVGGSGTVYEYDYANDGWYPTY